MVRGIGEEDQVYRRGNPKRKTRVGWMDSVGRIQKKASRKPKSQGKTERRAVEKTKKVELESQANAPTQAGKRANRQE